MATKLTKFFDQEIEPDAVCRNCDSFDGGGLTDEGKTVRDHGYCLNELSPWRMVTGESSCKWFFPCGKRWPDADHG